MQDLDTAPGRWQTYVLHRGHDLRVHWDDRFASGAKVALVCGVGFDPRMCLGLGLLNDAAPEGALAVHAVHFAAPATGAAAASAEETSAQFTALTADRRVFEIELPESADIDSVARNSAAAINDLSRFAEATDIVVDVNALPRFVFFPLISKLLYLCDALKVDGPNLHIFAGDAAWLDELIVPEGLNEHATWLHPFAGTFLTETESYLPRIWMPVLGEGAPLALQRISDEVKPAEICPLLPFPSRDPRRGDRLFELYREVLFDQLRADSGTVIYGSEGNPFQIYRRLRQSTLHYAKTLRPLGGCMVAYSALSSKLVALGVLLVAYELRDSPLEIGVVDLGAQQRRLTRLVEFDEAKSRTELVGLTVSGDAYL